MNRWNAVNARQRRWLAYLMQFNISVKFIKGCRNYAADALSRIFSDMTVEQKLEFAPDCSSNEEFIVALDETNEHVRKHDQIRTDDLSVVHSVMGDARQTDARKPADNICYRFLVDVDNVEATPPLNPDATPFVLQSNSVMEQADSSDNVFALSARGQQRLDEPRDHQPGAELSDDGDNSPLVSDTTPKQMLMQSEVLAVQSNNTQDNAIRTTTDDNVDQIAEADTTDKDRHSNDNGTTSRLKLQCP